MAFFAFLRIGEITVSKRDSVNGNLLQLDQVSKKHSGNGNMVSLIITFTSYKHDYNQNPFSLVLNRQPKACPVQSFLDYAVTLYHVTVFALLAFYCYVIQHSRMTASLDVCNKLCVQHGRLASFDCRITWCQNQSEIQPPVKKTRTIYRQTRYSYPSSCI